MHTFNSNTPGAGKILSSRPARTTEKQRDYHETGKAKSRVGSYNSSMSRITSKALEVVKRQGRILSSLELWNTKFLVSQAAFVILL